MSYCRFSCDDFKSDVYVYCSVQGIYHIIVAKNYIKGRIPKCQKLEDIYEETGTQKDYERYQAAWEKQKKFLKTAKREFYTGEKSFYNGNEFKFETPETTYTKLVALRKMGFHIPNHALERLKDECK